MARRRNPRPISMPPPAPPAYGVWKDEGLGSTLQLPRVRVYVGPHLHYPGTLVYAIHPLVDTTGLEPGITLAQGKNIALDVLESLLDELLTEVRRAGTEL